LVGMWICEEIHFEMVSATLLPSKLAWPLIQVKIIVRLVFLRRCQSKRYQEEKELVLELKGKVEED